MTENETGTTPQEEVKTEVKVEVTQPPIVKKEEKETIKNKMVTPEKETKQTHPKGVVGGVR